MQRPHHSGGAGYDGPNRPLRKASPSTGPADDNRSPPPSWQPEYHEQPPPQRPYSPQGQGGGRSYPPRPSSPPRHSQRPPPLQGAPFPSSSSQQGAAGSHRAAGPSESPTAPTLPTIAVPAAPVIKRVGGKANVSSACGPCKRAHLACDVARPCKRCVNMGKEDQCEDVPHKKRGRPKVNKTPTEPYQRPRIAPSDEGSTGGKWKRLSGGGYDASGYAMTTSPQQLSSGSGMPSRLPSPPRTSSLASAVRSKSASSSMSPYSGSAPATGVIRPSSQPPEDPIFTLFCSTEFKILRVTSNCHALTGFHPHEFINLNLLDWVLPADRQPLDVERARLITGPFGPQGQLQSSREIHAAIMNQPERDLLSPAVGMPEPYPHQNVHIHRADSGYSLFNVRLHLGGGLGGNIYQPETLGQIYLVVSCLFISAKDLPHESARRVAPFPLTPATPLTAPPPHSLPSFSSVVAAADAPPRERERERERHDYPYRSGSGTLPPSAGPPPLGHGPPGVPPPPMFQYRPGGHTRGGSMGGSIGSQGFTGASIRRSPSPIYGRPYTSYPPPGPWYGYERDDRGEHPREIRDYPRAPREIRDPRGVRDPQDVRDPRDLRDVHGSRDPRDWEDPRVSRGDLHVDPRSADSRDPRDLRDMDPRAREEYDRRAAHDERLREPRREDDWRRSAPPAPPPPHTHPHGHPLLSPSAGRHATYPPGVAPPGEARRHPQGPYRLEPPHPHHPPHPPSPHQQSPHQQSPHQGAFRIWEQQ